MPVKLTKSQLSQLNSSLLSFVYSFSSGTYDVVDTGANNGDVSISLNLIAGKRPETGGGLKKGKRGSKK